MSVLIIGIGNSYCGDDAVGHKVVQAIKTIDNNLQVLELDGEPAALMEAWKASSRVVLVDAIFSGNSPGHCVKLNLVEQSLPDSITHCSTHAFGLREAVELARAMGKLPEVLVFYGVEGQRFEPGDGMSSEVCDAIEKVARQIVSDIDLNRLDKCDTTVKTENG